MTLIENFQKALERSGKSQAQVARELREVAPDVHLSSSGVSGVLGGTRRPYLDQAIALARVLGVSLEELIEGAPPPPRGEVLTEDEKYVLRVFRGLDLNADEAVRRLAGKVTIEEVNDDNARKTSQGNRRRG